MTNEKTINRIEEAETRLLKRTRKKIEAMLNILLKLQTLVGDLDDLNSKSLERQRIRDLYSTCKMLEKETATVWHLVFELDECWAKKRKAALRVVE